MLLLFHKGSHLQVTKQQVFTILGSQKRDVTLQRSRTWLSFAQNKLQFDPICIYMTGKSKPEVCFDWCCTAVTWLLVCIAGCFRTGSKIVTCRSWHLNSEWLQTDAGTVSLQQQKCYWKKHTRNQNTTCTSALTTQNSLSVHFSAPHRAQQILGKLPTCDQYNCMSKHDFRNVTTCLLNICAICFQRQISDLLPAVKSSYLLLKWSSHWDQWLPDTSRNKHTDKAQLLTCLSAFKKGKMLILQ